MGAGAGQALQTSPERGCQLGAPGCITAGQFISSQSLLSSPSEHPQVPCASCYFAGVKPPSGTAL